MKYILNYSTTQEAKARESIPEERSINRVNKGSAYGRLRFGVTYDNSPDNFTEDGWYMFDDDTQAWQPGPYLKSDTPVKGRMEIYPDNIDDYYRFTSPDGQRELYGRREGYDDNWNNSFIMRELLRVEGDVYVMGNALLGYCYYFLSSDFKGGVSSIEPGVAYNKENSDVYYNIPKTVEFETSIFPYYREPSVHVSWEEAGIDSSAYEIYLKMAKNTRTDQSQWNIFALDGNNKLPVTDVTRWENDTNIYLMLTECEYNVIISPDGFNLDFGCMM